jgi:hypothetical protein
MRPINERMILIFILAIISVATILCLISLATPGWTGRNIFFVVTLPATLSTISLILLIACLIIAGIILSGIILHERLPYIFVSLLIITSIIILASFTSFFSSISNYSYSLMVAAFTFTYLSSIIATYWLFRVHDKNKMIVVSGKRSQPKLEILT